jgi:hypothetical protein
MENLMNEMVVDILSNPENYDKKKKEDPMTRCRRWWEPIGPRLVRRLSLCVDRQRAAVVANDENEHGHTYNIENKTRRKVGYRHMFRVVNGAREKRSSKTPPGMRRNWRSGLFPDDQYMGFMESEIIHLNLVKNF